VIVVHQEGFENAVSPMGTALTEVQMRQLKRYTRRFVLALDPDAAGVKATLRGLEVAREALDHSSDLVFDARGLLHNEARLQADLRVSTLPDELDPDEIVLRDPEEWKNIIADAKPIILHVLETLTADRDMDDPKNKSDVAARILPLIGDVPNPVERDAYRQQVARALQVDESSLALFFQQSKRRRSRKSEQAEAAGNAAERMHGDFNSQENIRAMELHILKYLVNDPEQIYRINRFMQNQTLDRLTQEDFHFSENQQILGLIYQAIQQSDIDPDDFMAARMGEISDMIPESASLPGESEEEKVDEKRELEDIIRTIMLIRQNAVNSQIQEYRFLQDNQSAPVEKSDQQIFQENLMKLIQSRRVLDKVLASPLQVE
jgi:DNA primase